MTTFADISIPPNSIWMTPEWVVERSKAKSNMAMYDGAELLALKDKDGNLAFPLGINPASKVCRIHRAVMFGMRDDIIELPVQPRIKDQDIDANDRRVMQKFLTDVWKDSDGVAALEESGLLLQIYGGHYFKVTWEPYNTNLQSGIAVRSLKSPAWCLPVYDLQDSFNLYKIYVGYYIDAEYAKLRYKIKPTPNGDDKVFYLESWDRDEWSIQVDGQPAFTELPNENKPKPLSGENKWGVVPFVYIPHERVGGFYGDSLVSGLRGLVRELNAREADLGDAVKEQTHRTLATKNTQGRSSLKMRRILGLDGKQQYEAVDLGNRPAMQWAGDPDLWALKNPDVPSGAQEFPDQIWTEIRTAADVASVAMGEDDVSGGRITGPVTAYRMWPTLSHAMTERSNFSMGMNHIDKIIFQVAKERIESGQYKMCGREDPDLDDRVLNCDITQAWYPMIPIEQSTKAEILNARLQAGGISVRNYLIEMREQNVDEEEAAIWADMVRKAEIENSAKETEDGNIRTDDEPGTED